MDAAGGRRSLGTVKWLPQWLHHNFLPVIGLRVHAKVPPSPLTDRQLVALGLWERKADRGLQCRALLQAVQLDFGLPTVFAVVGTWHTEVKGHTFDIVHCAQQMYTGMASSESQAMLDRPRKWAQWVFIGGALGRRFPHARPTSDVTL